MTQAERKGEKVARLNAQNVQMNTLWSNSNTNEFPTDCAERLSLEECILAEKRKCGLVSPNTFWLYKPHVTKEKNGKLLQNCVHYYIHVTQSQDYWHFEFWNLKFKFSVHSFLL